MDYTTQLESMSFELDPLDSYLEENIAQTLDFLNSKDSFRSFGEGLLHLISLKYPEITSENVANKISQFASKNGVPINEIASANTLTNWFKKDTRPKKGEASRNSMFALAFAMGFNLQETYDLFCKVYLDRAFNLRNEEELIYYFCIKNGKSWNDAKKLIEKTNDLNRDYSDKTIFTESIKRVADFLESEEKLLKVIEANAHNFEKNNVTSTNVISQLIERTKRVALVEIDRLDEEYKMGKHFTVKGISNNFLYETIINIKTSNKTGTKTVFKNVYLPQEIQSRFPEARTFSKKDLTYEERRKIIILLNFYCMCIHSESVGGMCDLDDFTNDTNEILKACSLPELYYGNPYDWLFLYCSTTDQSLDTFRHIIADVLPQQE